LILNELYLYMQIDKLEDIIINIFTGKYSEQETIEALAWGEKNNDVYLPLMQKHQPNYYINNNSGYPIMSCNIILDLKKVKRP